MSQYAYVLCDYDESGSERNWIAGGYVMDWQRWGSISKSQTTN